MIARIIKAVVFVWDNENRGGLLLDFDNSCFQKLKPLIFHYFILLSFLDFITVYSSIVKTLNNAFFVNNLKMKIMPTETS